MELIAIMEVFTICVTLGMFMTGIVPCIQMYKTGNTKNVPFNIFLMTSISCVGMTHYGLFLENTTLIFLNSIGSFLQIMYVLLYLLLNRSKAMTWFKFFLAAGYSTSLYYYMYNVLETDTERANLIGSASSNLTTLIVCLPVVEIVDNIRNKNADGIPTVMLLGGLATGVCWLILGLMLEDPNIYTPNIPGIAINLIKLYVIQLYSQTPHPKAE